MCELDLNFTVTESYSYDQTNATLPKRPNLTFLNIYVRYRAGHGRCSFGLVLLVVTSLLQTATTSILYASVSLEPLRQQFFGPDHGIRCFL